MMGLPGRKEVYRRAYGIGMPEEQGQGPTCLAEGRRSGGIVGPLGLARLRVVSSVHRAFATAMSRLCRATPRRRTHQGSRSVVRDDRAPHRKEESAVNLTPMTVENCHIMVQRR